MALRVRALRSACVKRPPLPAGALTRPLRLASLLRTGMYVCYRTASENARAGRLEAHMRLSNSAHEAHAWRIREIAPDFRLEDAWVLPVRGGLEDFASLL